jgi:hypothetical protein
MSCHFLRRPLHRLGKLLQLVEDGWQVAAIGARHEEHLHP